MYAFPAVGAMPQAKIFLSFAIFIICLQGVNCKVTTVPERPFGRLGGYLGWTRAEETAAQLCPPIFPNPPAWNFFLQFFLL